jgi:hypothetical protein
MGVVRLVQRVWFVRQPRDNRVVRLSAASPGSGRLGDGKAGRGAGQVPQWLPLVVDDVVPVSVFFLVIVVVDDVARK